MSNFLVAKLLLTVYKKLPLAVLHIDNAVDKTVRQSFYYRAGGSTMDCYNTLVQLNELKANYINIKVLCDNASSLMLKEDKLILQLRYVKKLSFKEISDKLGKSLRQTFRLFDGAIESFCAQLLCLGFDEESILEKYGHLPIIANELQNLESLSV
jgi:hypothetical protein